MDKEKIFSDLGNLFNKDEVEIVRDNNKITFTVRLYDTDFVGLDKNNIVNKEKKVYSHTVILNDDGTYDEVDAMNDVGGSIGIGGMNLGSQHNVGDFKMFKGVFCVLGRDNTTGKVGLISRTWDINEIKQPIKDYMATTGLTYKRSKENWSKELDANFNPTEKLVKKGVIIFVVGMFALVAIAFLIAILSSVL